MNKTIKVGLLSALVFPGAGHLLLKKYPMAIIYATAAALPLYYLIDITMTQTQLIVDKIILAGGNIDVSNINHLLNQQMANIDAEGINFATIALLCVWLVNIFDAIRLARKA